MERDTCLQGIFYICLDVSLYLKGPKKRAPLHVSQKWGSYGDRRPFPEPLGFPVKESSLQIPPHRVPSERDAPFLQPSFNHHSKSPVYKPMPPDARFPSDIKGPLCREMPLSGAFLNISSRVPGKGALQCYVQYLCNTIE